MGRPDDDADEDRGHVFRRHGEHVGEVLPRGNPDEIRGLYKRFGDELAEAVGVDEPPPLSYPETPDAVARTLAGSQGVLLDAGCGPNPRASIRVAGTGRLVIGLDIGHGMVSMASRVARAEGVDFVGVVGDLERLPFRDEVFGAVVCDDTIEHVPDDRQALAELARVTRRGGRLAVATPNRRRLDVLVARVRDLARARRRPPTAYFAAASHLREYTWNDLEQRLPASVVVRGRGHVPWTGGWRHRLASAVTRIRGLHLLGRVVLIELERR